MKPLDRWVFGLLGTCALGGALAFLPGNRERGSLPVAEILQEGRVVERVALDPSALPREWVLSSPGGGVNRVRLEGGRICMVEANCPDRDCVRAGWLDRPGQTAVCLPHRVALRVRGTGKGEGMDGISQ